MKIFPDFTWEWIIESCEKFCTEVERFIERDPGQSHETQKGYIQSARGLIAIVPQLRAHPQLERLVPVKSLLGLRWFPAEGWVVSLTCEESQVKYIIKVVRGVDRIEVQKVVAFDQVADEVYAFIAKLRQE